ncbi:MAG: transposase [Gammaproteobacteria bacterium]|nr:transposase [Gammaproteobacteria bacterium]
MGKSRYRITVPQAPHFFTATINQWIPIFTRPATVNIIYGSWHYLQQTTTFQLYGYVILENHIHFIAQSDQLSKHIQSFKSWTARSILDRLCEHNADFLLKQFAFYKKSHKTQSQYQFWQEGSHPRMIQDEVILRQKLEYIHQNPVKRGYVEQPEHWRYSSARNYAGLNGLIDVFIDW